jgi:hypothetical protein
LLNAAAFAVTAYQQGVGEAILQGVDVTGTGQAIRDMPCQPYAPPTEACFG